MENECINDVSQRGKTVFKVSLSNLEWGLLISEWAGMYVNGCKRSCQKFSRLEICLTHMSSLAHMCQFHQRFTRAFFVPKFVQNQTLSREKTFVQKMRA